MLDGEHMDLIRDFFARGGTIQHLPTPEPVTIVEVVDYLKECELDVHLAPRKGIERTYICETVVLKVEKLVEVANEYRAALDLPPFQLVPLLQKPDERNA